MGKKTRGPPEFMSRIFLREDLSKAGEPIEEQGRIILGGLEFRTCTLLLTKWGVTKIGKRTPLSPAVAAPG